MADLGGRVIACLEARHATEMADLVARHRGISYPAPCLREVHEPDAAQTLRAVTLLTGDSIGAAVFLTGVGVRTIAEGAERLGQMDQLRQSLADKRVAARGPKTQNVLRSLGIRVDVLAPEPFTSDSLLEEIQRTWNLQGQKVFVQMYGAPVPRFTTGLRQMGASVLDVAPYHWERPVDESAVVRLIEDVEEGWVDVLAATSAAQVENLFAIARDHGHEASLRKALGDSRTLVAAQGIVCASAFRREGISTDVIPPRASMGALLIEIARHFDSNAPRLSKQPFSPLVGTVAVLPTSDILGENLSLAIQAIPMQSRVTLLAGKDRRPERAMEEAAVLGGYAVQTFLPDTNASHPADELVRRADAVLIVTKTGLGVGRLLQLVHKYAKTVRVIRLDTEHPQPRAN